MCRGGPSTSSDDGDAGFVGHVNLRKVLKASFEVRIILEVDEDHK